MKDKTTLELAYRMGEIEKEIYNLELEYNMIIQELHRRNSNLKEDVNLQPKYEVSELIDRLLDGTYIDEVGEYTRIYPIKNCCKERLNIVKKKVRKYEDNRFVSENK